MSEKNIKSRIVHKHDTEANWSLATNFIPKQGELIIYDKDSTYDYERFKIGDGVTVVSSLPFIGAGKNLSGKTVPTNETTTVTAGIGAEVFNDYAEPTFSGDILQTGNVASGDYSHAEGSLTLATGDCSHSEGNYTFATGRCSHAEGWVTQADASTAHAEGSMTIASGGASHAEGMGTEAASQAQHVQGYYNIVDTEGSSSTRGKYAHIVGNGDMDTRSNAHTLDWDGNAWYAGDVYISSNSGTNKDDGSKKLATEEYVDSSLNTLVGDASVAEQITAAIANKADSDHGHDVATTSADGFMSSTDKTKLDGIAEGAEANVQPDWNTSDDASDAYIINKPSIKASSGEYSVLANSGNFAPGRCTFAQGNNTRAEGSCAFSSGNSTSASGSCSYAGGYLSQANGLRSHAEGLGVLASGDNQHSQGKYNVEDENSTYAHIVGNGTDDTERSNAHTLDWDGNAWFAGDIKIGGTSYSDSSAKAIATQEYVDSSHPTVDDALSSTSTNAVQNKVVNTAISNLQTLVGDTAVSTQITNAVSDKVDKDDCAWTQIYDSGAITTAVNAISGINVSGYKSLKVAIKCVNTTDNSTTAGGAIVFTCENGQDYVFANILGNLIRNTASTSGGAADFKVLDNYLACECSYRALNAENMLSDTEGAGADNLTTLCGGCYIKCTSPISTMMITNATQSDSLFYGVGSRVVVWGCKV